MFHCKSVLTNLSTMAFPNALASTDLTAPLHGGKAGKGDVSPCWTVEVDIIAKG